MLTAEHSGGPRFLQIHCYFFVVTTTNSPPSMKYLSRDNLSSRNPVKKQPTKEPIEFIMSMKETSPRVAPTMSVRSSRVGPTTPILNPQTAEWN